MRLKITRNISPSMYSGKEVELGRAQIAALEEELGLDRWQWAEPLSFQNRVKPEWSAPAPKPVEAQPKGDTLAERILTLLEPLRYTSFGGGERETCRKRLDAVQSALEERALLIAEEARHRLSLSLVQPSASDLEEQSARVNRLHVLSTVRIHKAVLALLEIAFEHEDEVASAKRWQPLDQVEAAEAPKGTLKSAAELAVEGTADDTVEGDGTALDSLRRQLVECVGQLDGQSLFFIGCQPSARTELSFVLKGQLPAFQKFEALAIEWLRRTEGRDCHEGAIQPHVAFQRLFAWRLAQLAESNPDPAAPGDAPVGELAEA